QLPFRAALEEYKQQAENLFDALKSGEEAAEWRFKWEHPRFRGKTVDAVKAATLDLADARLVIAQEYAFDTWADLEEFTGAVRHDGQVPRFESAVEAVIFGDAETLLDYGAALEGPGSNWQSALTTALAFGYPDTAETLVRRGASLNNVAAAAGLGRVDDAARLLPPADSKSKHIALALAAQHGR